MRERRRTLCSLVGEPHVGTAPFSSKVWNGIRELAVRDSNFKQYALKGIRFGWPQAPQPFSRRNAQVPLEEDEWWQMKKLSDSQMFSGAFGEYQITHMNVQLLTIPDVVLGSCTGLAEKFEQFGIPFRRKYPLKLGWNSEEFKPIFRGYFLLDGIPNRSTSGARSVFLVAAVWGCR